MKCKNRGGFTVIELVVYLGVVLGVLMINLMLIKVVQSGNPSEALFWRSFQSAWTRMTLNAKAENISYRISIRDKDVIFFPMKVKKTCCDLEKNEIYADVEILMDYGVKYTVRLEMLVTEYGDLRFIGAVG